MQPVTSKRRICLWCLPVTGAYKQNKQAGKGVWRGTQLYSSKPANMQCKILGGILLSTCTPLV